MSAPSPMITLTGVDERTSRADLQRLIDASPAVEIGILLSATPEGRRRYPPIERVGETVSFLGARCSVHLCGRRIKSLVFDGSRALGLRDAGRVQINGAYTVFQMVEALKIGCPIITQASFASVCGLTGNQILVDESGGRGVSPAAWARPNTPLPVGFAGGLGPYNLAAELPKIAAVARDPWWVDMESSLRDAEDWFSVEKAMECVRIFEAFCAKERS